MTFRFDDLACTVGAAVLLACPPAAPASVPAYTPAGSFSFAASAWDVRADGRLIGISGDTILLQDVVNATGATALGSVDPGLIAPWGASFLRLSPGGSRIAIGDNQSSAAAKIYLVNTTDLNTAGPTTPAGVTGPNYAAAWDTDDRLYVAGGVFGSPASLTRIHLTPSLGATQVVSDAGGASGGVATRGGSLYLGVGFDGSGSSSGDIRRFDLGALGGAGGPVPYLTGDFVGNALSAASLDFDALGNLIVGGFGSVAVIDPVTLDCIDLAPAGEQFYIAQFNSATGEVLVNPFGSATMYRYAIPAPGTIGAVLVLAAIRAPRRRR